MPFKQKGVFAKCCEKCSTGTQQSPVLQGRRYFRISILRVAVKSPAVSVQQRYPTHSQPIRGLECLPDYHRSDLLWMDRLSRSVMRPTRGLRCSQHHRYLGRRAKLRGDSRVNRDHFGVRFLPMPLRDNQSLSLGRAPIRYLRSVPVRSQCVLLRFGSHCRRCLRTLSDRVRAKRNRFVGVQTFRQRQLRGTGRSQCHLSGDCPVRDRGVVCIRNA